MSGRPGRRVRFPAPQELVAAPEPVPVLGPMAFSANFDGGIERRFDLSHLPCPRGRSQ